MPLPLPSICLSFLAAVSVVAGFSQSATLPSGSWFEKPVAYAFRNQGTASIYGNVPDSPFTRKLTIYPEGNYSFWEIVRDDTVYTRGRVAIDNDTLIFYPGNVDSTRIAAGRVDKLLIYFADQSRLILSNPIQASPVEDPVFGKIETSASYKYGEREFLKQLYRSVATNARHDRDSVQLHIYEVFVDETGRVELSSLKCSGNSSKHLALVRQTLSNLRSSFIPATQNGRAIGSRMIIRFNY